MPSKELKQVQRSVSNSGDSFGAEISGLSAAVQTLKDACCRLEGSVDGISDDLENTNERLAVVAKTHADAAAYLENILGNISSGVVAVDCQGKIVLFNSAAAALTGFSTEEAMGRSYIKMLAKDGQEKVTPVFTLATGYPIQQQEKTLITKTGEAIPVSFSTSVLIDRDNRVAGAIEVLTDLRKIKQLEQEASRVKRLAAVGEVAAAVAHELRNPLSGMKGFTSLLERDLAGDEKHLALIRKVKEGIASLEHIANDLLEAGRPITIERRRVDLVPQMKRVMELFQMATVAEGKNIIFRLTPSNTPFFCNVEVERIRQAVTNLVRNAVEAVGNAGTVTIELYASRSVANSIAHDDGGDVPGHEHAYIAVSDTGPGISKDIEKKLFLPFFTTRKDGTGLGLHIVRKIANLHGGEIRYSRTEAGGGRFIIGIPRW